MNVRKLVLWIGRAGAATCVAALFACGGGGGGDTVGVAPLPAPTVALFAGALQSAGSRDDVGTAAQFRGPTGVAQDGAGNIYVADAGNHTIRKIAIDATVSTLAGSPGQAGSADGIGVAARFSNPRGIAVDAAGNVYVADTGNSTLRRISTTGVVTTIMGLAGQAGNTDGDAAAARLRAPTALAVNGAGTIYVVDDNALRKRAPDGTVSTFAGKGGDHGPAASGNAAQSRFLLLSCVAVDAAGDVYVADNPPSFIGAGNLRKFDSQGQALAFGPSADGLLPLRYPAGIAVDAAGTVYVVLNGDDSIGPSKNFPHRSIEMITPAGMGQVTLTGLNTTASQPRDYDRRTVDGPLAAARFTDPGAIAVGLNGRIAIAESAINGIRLVNPQQDAVSTLAGGSGGGDVDGVASAARFNDPRGIAVGQDGMLYVADNRNQSVRKIGAAGAVSTFARGVGYAENVATSGTASVYVLDGNSSVCCRPVGAIAPSGTASNVPRFAGLATDSSFAFAADTSGNLYASENRDLIVLAPGGARRVLATGISALNLAVDEASNVYFTSSHFTVGVVDPSGNVVIRAGRTDEAGDVNGVGEAARFRAPYALAIDGAGTMYISDGTKIRKVTADGTVTTVADITQVTGASPGFAGNAIGRVNGLAWSADALYASVLNAVIRITR